MKSIVFAFLISFTSCAGPAYKTADAIAPTCPGFHQYNQCEPWARAFKTRMESWGVPVTLVGYQWSHHNETVNHLAAFWRDSDGWYARDNFNGPVQVDSFNRYDWKTRVENFVYPMPGAGFEVVPTGDWHVTNVRIVDGNWRGVQSARTKTVLVRHGSF